MQGILTGGPVDGEIRDVGTRPPPNIDVEAPVEGDDELRPIPPGGEFPEMLFEMHRYVLSNVEGDPTAPEPRAKYSHQGKLPEV